MSVVVVSMFLLAACGGSDSTDGDTAAATTSRPAVPTTAEVVAYEDGQPGSCRVLEEKYCSLGELVRWDNDFGFLFVGFSLPPGTPLFAFGGGEVREMFWSPGPTGDAATSYPGVRVPGTEPEVGVVEAVVLFMNRDGEPDVHLTEVERGDTVGYLTSETLPVLPLGIQDDVAYNLLVYLGDFDTASPAAYQEYFGLTEP